MVTQPVEPDTSALEPAGDGLDFEITDSTSPEQRALEAKALAEADEDSGEVPQPEAEQAPEAAPAETPAPSAQTPSPEPTPEPTPEPKPVRTYSQEEVSKMQSAWMRQIQTQQQAARAAQEQLEKFNLDATVEAALRQQERELTPEYGAEDARKIVRAPANAQAVREAAELKQQVAREKAERESQSQQQEQQAKLIVAGQLMQQHSLPPEDFDLLISAADPNGMVRLAQRLAKQAQAQQQQDIKARVPRETAATKPENGASPGSGPLNHDQMLARVRQKPMKDWTDAEHNFMRTGRV